MLQLTYKEFFLNKKDREIFFSLIILKEHILKVIPSAHTYFLI